MYIKGIRFKIKFIIEHISTTYKKYFLLLNIRINTNLQLHTGISSHAEAPRVSILGPKLFLLYINELPEDVICNIAIYADDTTLYSKCDQASDLWQQLELASELEFDLRDAGLRQEMAC